MGIGGLVSAYRFDKTSLILPTIYEDVLSYQEQLKKISMHFNALLDIVDKDGNGIDKLQSDLTALTNNYNALVVKVNELEVAVESELNEIKNDITNNRKDTLLRLAELKVYVDNGDKKLKEDMETLKTYLLIAISKAENDANLYTDLKIDALRTLHDMDIDAINERIDNINQEFNSVYNPITGKKDSIDDVVMCLYRHLRDNCVTATEYDTLGLTAKEYDDIGMTALDYDLCSYLVLYGRDNKMFSPFTGKYVPTKEVIRDLFDAINVNGKSAKEYDRLEFTASEFDNSDFDAYAQDTNKSYDTIRLQTDNSLVKDYMDMQGVSLQYFIGNKNGLVGGFGLNTKDFDFTNNDSRFCVEWIPYVYTDTTTLGQGGKQLTFFDTRCTLQTKKYFRQVSYNKNTNVLSITNLYNNVDGTKITDDTIKDIIIRKVYKVTNNNAIKNFGGDDM